MSPSTRGDAPTAATTTTLVGLTLLAALLHVLGSGWRPLWLDEACTYWTVQAAPLDLLGGVRTDGSPPLHFLLVQVATRLLGSSELVLRLPSILAATALVPAAYSVAAQLGTRRMALTAAGLAALSPLVHFYSIEARSYALVQVETLAIVYATLRAMREPYRGRWWLLLGLSQAIQLWTHNFALFLLPVPAVACLLAGGPGRWSLVLRASAAAATAFVLDLPWFLMALQASGLGVGDWIRPFWERTPPVLAIVRSLEVFGVGGQYPDYLSDLGDAPVFRAIAVPAGLALLALAAWPSKEGQERGRPAVAALYCFLFLPLLAVWAYSFLRPPLYLVGRYDTMVLPVYLILIACGLERILGVWPRAGWVAHASLAAVAAMTWTSATQSSTRMPRDVLAAQRLAPEVGREDLVVSTGLRRAVVEYYLHRAGRRPEITSFPAEMAEHPGWRSPKRMLRDDPGLRRDAEQLRDRMVAAAQTGHSVWLLSSGRNDVDNYLLLSLAGRLDVDRSRSHRDAGLLRLTLSPPKGPAATAP